MSVVLDTNVILYHLAGRLIDPLPADARVSVITEIELLSYPSLSKSEEASIRQLLSSVQVLTITEPVVTASILVRKAHKVKLADAIIIATAQVATAELWTLDAALVRLNLVNTIAPALL